MDIKNVLKQSMLDAVNKAFPDKISIDLNDIEFEVPPQKSFGDFSTNFAMKSAKHLRSSPRKIAEAIQNNIFNNVLDKIEIAGPGFINFYLKKDWLYEALNDILKKGNEYGTLPINDEKPILVEYVSANPTGPLHIGHGRGAAVGSALVNLFKAAGYSVKSEYYINDAGNQIDMLADSVEARYFELLNIPCVFPENGYKGQDIIETAKKIISQDGDKYVDMDASERLSIFKEIALNEKIAILKEDLQFFNVSFDEWFSERTLYDKEIGKCVDDLIEKGFIYEKDGAKWLRSTDFGDDKDRVVIRENGVSTYLASDIAYHKNKFERGFHHLINIWGADHHGYIQRMKAACEALGYKGEQLEIMLLQMVNLFRDGELIKMSKRTGKSITLNELIEEVGCDAARYYFIMRSVDSQLDFDLSLAVEKSNENPVFYIQYAHARICSIFRTLKDENIELNNDIDLFALTNELEFDVIRKLSEYEEEIFFAAKDRAPHKIATFLHELAGNFHSFYNVCRIRGEGKKVQQARLALVLAVKNCLAHGLGILGINAPEQM